MNGRHDSSRRMGGRALVPTAAMLLAISLQGCTSFDGIFEERTGEIELVSLGATPLVLGRELVTGAYVRKESEDSYWFSDVPFDALLAHERGTPLENALFVHAQLLWTPKPGLTPLDTTATNLALRVVVVSGGEVGIYGGAGFARPDGDPTVGPMSLEIEGATLTLLEKTGGFHDLLSPAGFDATLRAPLAPDDANRWRRGVSQFATNALGKSMWVNATPSLDVSADDTARALSRAPHGS
ncbi:MAG: hypothetical protein ACKO3W_11835 [bacterium]